MRNLQWPELLLIALVVVLLFGARKLPETAKGLGQALRIFKREVKDEPPTTAEAPKQLPPSQPVVPPSSVTPPAPDTVPETEPTER